jgi:phenylacetaldehyde dehydrogenase
MIYYTSKRLLSTTIPGIKGTINLKTDLLIGGKWQAAKDGRTFETIDPSTGKVIAKVASAGKADVDLAVIASQEAVKDWSKVSP